MEQMPEGSAPDLNRRIALLAAILLSAFFTVAPLSPKALTLSAGLIALTGAVVGWRGLPLLPPATRMLWIAFGLYVASALLSLINNEEWHRAGARFEKYHPFLFAIPITGWLALSRPRLKTALLIGMLGAALTLTATALYEQLALGVERVGYLTGHEPNIFGHLASLVALLLFGYGLFGHCDRRLRVALLLGGVGAVYSIMATGTRGALLAFAGGFIVMGAAWFLRNGICRKRLLQLTALLLAGIGIVALTFALSDFWRAHWERLLSEPAQFMAGDTRYTSIGARMTLWMSGWKTAMANFWIGTGIGDNQLDYNRLMAAGELPPFPDNSHFHLHNIFIDAFASTGIIGLAAMVSAVFIVPAIHFSRQLRSGASDSEQDPAAAIGLGILTNGFLFGMTYSWLYIRGLHFFLLLLLALIVLSASGRRIRSVEK